jgi:uncharacterized protein (DUF2062 family)
MSITKQPLQGDHDRWWRRWFLNPITTQLTCGITPEKLSWTVAAGMVLGIFPIMGTTTTLCLIVGWMLKLNQPVLHVARAVVYPLHLLLILVFIHLGQWICGVPQLVFSISELMSRFKSSPMGFMRDFGMAAAQGVLAWAIIAPFAICIIRMAALPVLRRAAGLIAIKQKEKA